MKFEASERRVLGAVSFQDATTGLRVRNPLKVEARGVKFVRNRSGCYVIFAAPKFEDYIDSFSQQPVAPDERSVATETVAVELKVRDERREYLPRRSTIHLPLNPAPARPPEGAWLFEPLAITLFPSPSAGTIPGWAIIRATVREDGKTDRLPWALIRVKRVGNTEPVALGLADERGEALVAVPGLPVQTADEGAGAVLTSQIPVSIEVVFDTSLEKVRDPEDLEALLLLAPDGYVPDPSALLEGEAPQFRQSTTNANLASGRERRMELNVNLT